MLWIILPRFIPAQNPNALSPSIHSSIFTISKIIDIQSLDGDHLERFGHDIQKDMTEHHKYQLRDQVCLVNCLPGKVREDLDLPVQAVSGLADLMFRMQDFCDLHVK